MRAFRRNPPDLGSRVLLRPRLLARLTGRFEHPVLTIVAPAGYGKTTLLAQAVYENALAPRGVDVWLSCEARDASASHLAAGVIEALDAEPDGQQAATPERAAELIWARSPLPVALLLDDVHEIPTRSPGAAWLDALVRGLPANGHLVLAGRAAPPVALSRLRALGAVARIEADELLLDEAELAELAGLHGRLPADLHATGGWAALAALTAAGAAEETGRFAWEEVLSRMTPAAREVLAVLVAIGDGDDELVGAVLGRAVRLPEVLEGVPLVSQVGTRFRPHALWEPILADTDTTSDRLRRRAAAVLAERRDVARAAALLLPAVDDDDWEILRDVIAEGCHLAHWVAHADLLPAWLGALADGRRGEPEGVLLEATVARLRQTHGEDNAPAMNRAASLAREAGRWSAEWSALTQLAHIAWWQNDLASAALILPRARELADAGVRSARALLGVGDAMFAQIAHDYERMVAVAERIDRDQLDADFRACADWLHARALINLGRAGEAVVLADRAVQGFVFQAARMERLHARLHSGDTAGALALLDELDLSTERLPRDRFLVGVTAAAGHALFGRLEQAHRALAVAAGAVGAVEGARPQYYLAQTKAIIAVGEGDEDQARATMREALGSAGFTVAVMEAIRSLLGYIYVLLPEHRPSLDGFPHGPDQREALAVARAFVAIREEGRRAPIPARGARVLAALGLRWATEAAAATDDASLAASVIEIVGEPGRAALEVATRSPDRQVAAGARRLLRDQPAPPEDHLVLRILGPAILERGGSIVADPEWRRERVRSLLLYLVAHRRVTREKAATALWPDLDAEAATGNLRVTLGYLHRVLEPRRPQGSAPYVVSTLGDVLLLRDELLWVDAWELDAALDRAAAADAAGIPSSALAELERALDLWRGDYLADVYDDWAQPERDRLRSRFLAASVRCGELLIARGEVDRALHLATRAIELERWYEPAHRLAMAAHLQRGDRASARRALDRCYEALGELGVTPDHDTAMVERRILTPID